SPIFVISIFEKTDSQDKCPGTSPCNTGVTAKSTLVVKRLHMSKEDSIPAEGTVVDRMPNALFKVRLDSSEHEILAQVSGKIRKHSIRILLGDRVSIDMSPYDLSKGRIVYRHR